MIVVDVGCARQGHDESISPLIERFHPEALYGFDPSPALTPGSFEIDGCRVHLDRRAAWTRGGWLRYADAGIDATVMPEKNALREWWDSPIFQVPCFDLAAWLLGYVWLLGPPWPVVKLDCEGAEFPILEHMLRTGADQVIALLLVEWHDDVMIDPFFPEIRRKLERTLRCPIEEWH